MESSPEGEHSQGQPVVFNIKGNDYRLSAVVQYAHGVLMIGLAQQEKNDAYPALRVIIAAVIG
jgi:mRNA-degrading endonuclease HigB of HigAB toxin-antitoxin module